MLWIAASAPAFAEVPPIPPPEPVPAPPAPPAEREPSADEVAGQPQPGQEHGRLDPVDEGDSTLRQIGRGVLFVPKVAIDTALQPVRAGLWAWDRFQLEDLYYRIFFFDDARTIGIVPTVGYDYGFGVNGVYGGARFVDRNLFGEHEHLSIEAATGMMYRQIYTAQLRSGDRFGKRFSMILDGGFEQRPEDPFYGIGNGNLVAPPAMQIDPRTDDTAVFVRYRQQRIRAALTADARLWSNFHVRAGGAVTDVQFDRSDLGMPIGQIYDTSRLNGWAGTRDAYGELELRWDSRRRTTVYEPRAVYATGSLVSAFGGREHNLEGGSDFWRLGFDLQHFFRVGEGPRVLITRLHGESVTGNRDEIPFVELPTLGGLTYLRGYAYDRFRDRVAGFGSVEYQWDLAYSLSANLFVDAGRVYDQVGDVNSLSGMRVGYGFGLEAHTMNAFVVDASIASSIDGGFMLNLAFNPIFTLEDRVRRQ